MKCTYQKSSPFHKRAVAGWFGFQMWSIGIRQRNACCITKCGILKIPLHLRLELETNAARRGLLAELSADKETSDDPSAGRRRSWIWSHFELMDGSARCRLCSENLQACKGGSTGNMHRHMSAKHPEVFKPTLTHSSMKRLSGIELYISTHPQWLIPLFRM